MSHNMLIYWSHAPVGLTASPLRTAYDLNSGPGL